MSLSHVLAFALLSVVVVAVPGPSVLFTIGRALTVGRREALMTVAGNAIGVYLQVVAVAVGVGVVVERSAAVFTVIKLVGAAYLVYLGVQAIRHRRKVTEVLAEGMHHPRPGDRAQACLRPVRRLRTGPLPRPAGKAAARPRRGRFRTIPGGGVDGGRLTPGASRRTTVEPGYGRSAHGCVA